MSYRTEKADDFSFFISPTSDGYGVDVFVVDTGINLKHNEFIGRLSPGVSFITGETTDDGNGHGTHVAGSIAGTNYGVANKATLIPVKVLSKTGSGSTTGVISGVNWVASNVKKGRPAVANLSLGGGYSLTLNNAVSAAIKAGVTFVVAAGNSNDDSSKYSPASNAEAIVVGATDSSDHRASFSNCGTTVTIMAPGVNTFSAWVGNPAATNTISGTSMASPLVAGVAALYLGENPTASPAAVKSHIQSVATPLHVSGNWEISAGVKCPPTLAYIDCDEIKCA
jgi:subtilisin family serine protease